MQTASRCESRAKCRDTSMHWRMIRIDTDFRFKNTDYPHKIVACLDKMDGTTHTIMNTALAAGIVTKCINVMRFSMCRLECISKWSTDKTGGASNLCSRGGEGRGEGGREGREGTEGRGGRGGREVREGREGGSEGEREGGARTKSPIRPPTLRNITSSNGSFQMPHILDVR